MNIELWEKVEDLLAQQSDRESLSAVLSVLLTREEREAIGSRLAILQTLLAGEKPQREISQHLGVSIAKVTRCSNYLKTLNAPEKQLIKG